MITAISALALLVLGSPIDATPAAKDISALLAPIRAHQDVPGLVACVVAHNEVVSIGADGVRERGKDAAITIDDKMHLGSCTKSMTATLCALLVEEGKLSWDTTLESAFPELAATMHPDWKAVRLEQLLTHRAGVPGDLNADGLWGKLWAFDGKPEDARMMLVRGVLEHAPAAKPGTKYIYSNAGISIAGVMAERAAKMPYEKLLRQRLFVPLGMTSAGFGAPGTKRKDDEGPDQPIGHRANGSPIGLGRDADNPPAITPAGRVHCSIGDWAKYIELHLAGERATNGSKPFLSPETFHKLHAEVGSGDERYAMGWAVTERPWGGRVLTHSGSNTLWYCVVWMTIEKDFAVLVCCNEGGDKAAKACDEAAWALISDHQNEMKAAGGAPGPKEHK